LLLAQAGERWGRLDRVTTGYVWCLLFMALSTASSAQGLYAPHTVALWISIGMLARRLHSGQLADSAGCAEIASTG